MSAADNTSNLSDNSTDVYEDELFTWLQYPADDAFERNYCSDSFGGVLSPPNAVVAKTHSDAHPRAAGYLSDVGIHTCTGSASSRLPIKKNVGTKSFSRPSSNAEDALALGAARAAGHSSQVGHDAFKKVRTSMQPQAIITAPCSALKVFDHKDCPVLKPKIPVPYASKPAQGGVESSRLHMANSFSSMETSKYAPSASISLAMEKSGKVQETYSQQLTHTQKTRSSHITGEDSNGRVYGKYAGSHSSTAPLSGNAKVNGAMATSSNSFNVKGKMGWSDHTSESLPSYSGGSQTSMSLSFREMTYGGKRKHEVSELRSEDADDEMRNGKVPRKSSSRRNRVSEVHNLSERNRRNRINEKLKALQDLIPNSSKTDKASVLDEAIEYMKTLQLQLQMVSMRSSMNMTPVMMPMAFPPTPMHMAPLHSIGLGVPIGHAGLGVGLGMGMNMDVGLPPQSGRAVPFQPAPAAMAQYIIPLERGNTASLHDSGQACVNAGLLPTHPLASMQKAHEPFERIHSRSLNSPYVHECQQQEQGQHLIYPFHEQQDGLSD